MQYHLCPVRALWPSKLCFVVMFWFSCAICNGSCICLCKIRTPGPAVSRVMVADTRLVWPAPFRHSQPRIAPII
jgi:hypothetical protein